MLGTSEEDYPVSVSVSSCTCMRHTVVNRNKLQTERIDEKLNKINWFHIYNDSSLKRSSNKRWKQR